MKRIIMGLGVGVILLLCFSTSLQAFDRDINLPSPNASDPKWIFQAIEGDEGGWDEPIHSPGIIPDDGFWWFPVWDGVLIRHLWNSYILSDIKHPIANTQIGNIGTDENAEPTENSSFTGR